MNKLLIALIAGAGLAAAGAAVAADVSAGKDMAGKVCAACHGVDGNTPLMPEYPKLAGQPADYLAKALGDYKSGARKNPLMGPQAQNLTKKDIMNLAAYFSSLNGDLRVKY
jgi:cytochrome c553